MLQDLLIEGTSSPKGGLPPEEKIRVGAGARVYPVNVKQGHEDVPTKPAYRLIGRPVSSQVLDQIRTQHNLSENYGAIFIPMTLLQGVNMDSSKGIVGVERDHYVVRGLLPSKELRCDSTLRGYLARDGTEEEVYASPEDFQGLRL